MTLLTLPQDLLVAVLRKMCVRDVARVGCARRDNEWWLAAVRQLLFEARAVGLGDVVEISTESPIHQLARCMGVGWSMTLEFVKKVYKSANLYIYREELVFEFAALEKLYVALRSCEGDAMLQKIIKLAICHLESDLFLSDGSCFRPSPFDCYHVRLQHVDRAISNCFSEQLPVWSIVQAADVEDRDSDLDYVPSGEDGEEEEDEVEDQTHYAVLAPQGSRYGGVSLRRYSTREDFLDDQMDEEHGIPPSVLQTLPLEMRGHRWSPNGLLTPTHLQDLPLESSLECKSDYCCHQRCACLVLKINTYVGISSEEQFRRILRNLPLQFGRGRPMHCGESKHTGARCWACAAVGLDVKLFRAHRSCLRFLNQGWDDCMEVVEAERAANPGKFVEVIEQLTLANSQLIEDDEGEDDDEDEEDEDEDEDEDAMLGE